MNDAATADDAAPERLDWRLMLPVFLVVSLYAASAASTLPILPFYIQEMGGTPLILGIVMGTEALTHLVAAPLIGQLPDRLGRKRILLATQATAFVSLLLLGLAQAVIPVLLARMLFGFTGGTFAAAAAYAADHSSPANRRQAIGTLHAGVGLGGIVGAGISGYLSDISLTAPIYAAMVLSAVSFTVTALWLKGSPAASQTPDPSREVSFRSIVGSPLIRVLVVVLLCYFFAYGMYSSQLANYLQASFVTPENPFGPRELGYVLAADGAINILVQLFLLRWLGRFFTSAPVRRPALRHAFPVACAERSDAGLDDRGLATASAALILDSGKSLRDAGARCSTPPCPAASRPMPFPADYSTAISIAYADFGTDAGDYDLASFPNPGHDDAERTRGAARRPAARRAGTRLYAARQSRPASRQAGAPARQAGRQGQFRGAAEDQGTRRLLIRQGVPP